MGRRKSFLLIIVGLFSLLLLPLLSLDAQEIIKKEHKRFYQAGSTIKLGEILGIETIEGELRKVSIVYNMLFSSLKVEWIYNGKVLGQSTMPKGLDQKVTFFYNKLLPANLEAKFTGEKGQVQVLAIRASVVKSAAKSQEVYFPEKIPASSMNMESKISQIFVIDPSLTGKERENAERIRSELIRKVIEVNFIEPKVIEVNIARKNTITIFTKGETLFLTGTLEGTNRTETDLQELVRDTLSRAPRIRNIDTSGLKLLATTLKRYNTSSWQIRKPSPSTQQQTTSLQFQRLFNQLFKIDPSLTGEDREMAKKVAEDLQKRLKRMMDPGEWIKENIARGNSVLISAMKNKVSFKGIPENIDEDLARKLKEAFQGLGKNAVVDTMQLKLIPGLLPRKSGTTWRILTPSKTVPSQTGNMRVFFQKIALRAYNGKYVCPDQSLNGEMIANRTTIGPWEIFEPIPQGGNKYALKTSYGKYVCADLGLGGKLYGNRDKIGPWEVFELVQLGGGKVALRASNGKYVCADQGLGDILIANRTTIGEWETFYLVKK